MERESDFLQCYLSNLQKLYNLFLGNPEENQNLLNILMNSSIMANNQNSNFSFLSNNAITAETKLDIKTSIDDHKLNRNISKIEEFTPNDKSEIKLRIRNDYYSKLTSLIISKYAQKCKTSMIGAYTLEERMKKIIQFKLKQYKYREKCPPIRRFKGRSDVAKSKNRSKGRFIKMI